MFRFLTFLSLILCLTTCGSNDNSTSDETTETSTPSAEPLPMKLKGQEVGYKADGINMKGYLVFNENETERKPAVIVVHEWWGHNEYTRKRAEMLAELGYVALAIDMYGDGKQAAHPDDAGKFAGQVMGNIDGAKARFERAFQMLKNYPKVDSTKIAAIGYCFGGSVALTMANLGLDLDAVAAFHSGVKLPEAPKAGMLKAKVLVCNGADDPFIPEESVTEFKSAMDAANANYEYVAYPGAVHAFTNPGADELGKKFDLPLAYNKEADDKSWQALQDLLESVF